MEICAVSAEHWWRLACAPCRFFAASLFRSLFALYHFVADFHFRSSLDPYCTKQNNSRFQSIFRFLIQSVDTQMRFCRNKFLVKQVTEHTKYYAAINWLNIRLFRNWHMLRNKLLNILLCAKFILFLPRKKRILKSDNLWQYCVRHICAEMVENKNQLMTSRGLKLNNNFLLSYIRNPIISFVILIIPLYFKVIARSVKIFSKPNNQFHHGWKEAVAVENVANYY